MPLSSFDCTQLVNEMLSGPSILVAETKSLTRDNLEEEGPILAQSLKEVSP